MPPELSGGIGEEGVKHLRKFVEDGGTLVLLNRASEFAIEQFKLTVRNVVGGLPRAEFYVPGSILRLRLIQVIHWRGKCRKSRSPGRKIRLCLRLDRRNDSGDIAPSQARIVAWYPRDKEPLLSGWLLGADRIKGKAAMVEVSIGKGRMILFGFRPQYRAQSLATYPLFFNAITYPQSTILNRHRSMFGF